MAALLLEAGIAFVAIAIGGAAALRFGQSVIPAYILVGVLVGPNAPHPELVLVHPNEFIDLAAELGIVLLLFFIGLEFDVETLRRSWNRILRAGGLDFGINFGVGLALGVLLGFALVETLVLAGMVYISSSAVITKTLVDLGWIADPESEGVIGVLVFEDVVIAVYLAIVAPLAAGGDDVVAPLARSLAVLVALVLVAAYATPLFTRLFSVEGESLLFRVLGVATLVGGLALAAGVSEAVAAFFVGTAVDQSLAHRIEAKLTDLRDLFAAVFFFSVGLAVDPGTVPNIAVPLVLVVVVTTAAKLASGYLGGRAFGLTRRRSARMGTAMVARGEFTLVLAAIALDAGLETVPTLGIAYVLVMALLGTLLMRYSGPFERLATRSERAGGDPEAA